MGWKRFFRRAKWDAERARELDAHLEIETDENVARGMPPEEAQAAARRKLGNTACIREEIYRMNTVAFVDTLGRDLRYALRSMRWNPTFMLIAVSTLALGIGATSALFSLVDATVIRPLPYPEPSSLVMLWGNVRREQVERRGVSRPDYADWRDQSRSFEDMAMFTAGPFTLSGSGEPERIPGEFVAEPYFRLLGVRPLLGRTFLPEEDHVPQRDAVVVLSARLWQRRFGGAPSLVGNAVRLDDRPFTVIGIMPEGFHGIGDEAELWVPLHMERPAEAFQDRGSRGPGVLARLRAGVSLAEAQVEMDEISRRLEEQFPETNEARGVEIRPLDRELKSRFRPTIVLFAAVVFLLALACANVANLLLVRSEARQHEIAVRAALGAGHGRILRQLTTESLLLAFLGAALGVATVYASLPSLMAVAPITFRSYMTPQIDWRATAFAVALSSTIGLLLGLAPAVHVRTGMHGLLKRAPGRSGGPRTSRRLRDLLVIAEIGCATLLVIGAGLFIRSMNALASVERGYDPSGVLTLRVTFPGVEVAVDGAAPSTDTPNPRIAASLGQVLERLAATPGIDAVAAGTDVPMTGSSAIFYAAEGQPPVTAEDRPRAYRHSVTPGFFEALGIPLLAGRTFTESELRWDGVSDTGIIVTEKLVNRFWPGQDPVGKRIKRDNPDAPWWHVVGVVNDLKYRGIPDNPTADPDIFLPYSAVSGERTLFLLVRTALDPSATVPLVREAIDEVDRNTLISEVVPLETLLARRAALPRLAGWLLGIFGATAAMLAAIGIYGVMSYAIARRRTEVGLRVALGASRWDILGMFARNGARLIAIGLSLGVVATIGLMRLIGALLYGIEPTDPATYLTTAGALAAVALAACLIPSIRASRAAPAAVLREDH